jgi:hypothetical protein
MIVGTIATTSALTSATTSTMAIAFTNVITLYL